MTLPLLPVRTAAPGDLLDLEVVKSHLRVDHSDDDELIQAIVAAAVERVDGYGGILGRCLMEQTWKAYFRDFSAGRLRLPLGPLISITSVKYYDTSNVEQTFGSSNYVALTDALGPFVALASPTGAWPTSLYDRQDAVSVIFKAGHATAAAVPAPIGQALRLTISHWYENREAVLINVTAMPLPLGAEALLAPYRAGSF